jgi:hypothetical protein
MVAMPKFHWPAVALAEGDRDRLVVSRGVEHLNLVDVTTVTVEEIEAIILHCDAKPPCPAFYHFIADSTKVAGPFRLGYREMTVFKCLSQIAS